MNADRSPSPQQAAEQDTEDGENVLGTGPGPGSIAAAAQRSLNEPDQPRDRSPTPPRALFRSTTGKGVAFTEEDISFLVRFMEYRKSVFHVGCYQPSDSVLTSVVVQITRPPRHGSFLEGRGYQGYNHFGLCLFSTAVLRIIQAPHHSRASWMKFWRRHKHELNRTETDDPLPQPPEKKMRYSRGDDILLAKYFFGKPEGTSDKIFQAFGRMVSLSPKTVTSTSSKAT
jgi:hypothetical protein